MFKRNKKKLKNQDLQIENKTNSINLKEMIKKQIKAIKKLKWLVRKKQSRVLQFIKQNEDYLTKFGDDVVDIKDLNTNFKLKMGFQAKDPIFDNVIVEIQKALILNTEISLAQLGLYITYKSEDKFIYPVLSKETNTSFQAIQISDPFIFKAYRDFVDFICLLLKNNRPISFLNKFIIIPDGEKQYRISITKESLTFDVSR